MNSLITGGAGFIGSHVVRRFVNNYGECNIYNLDALTYAGNLENLEDVEKAPNYHFIKGDGYQLGCDFQYAVQESPKGLAEAFIIGEKFIGKDKVALILRDNNFYGSGLAKLLQENNDPVGGVIYGYHVQDPERYGVVGFDEYGSAISIEEKPEYPKSNFAVPGIYFYDNDVVEISKQVAPSKRGELEITDVNRAYLEKGKLKVGILDRGKVWLDTSTFSSLMQASQFVEVIEEHQGLKIGAIEGVDYSMRYINKKQLHILADSLLKSGYGKYLLDL